MVFRVSPIDLLLQAPKYGAAVSFPLVKIAEKKSFFLPTGFHPDPDPLCSLTLDAPLSPKPVANASSFSAANSGQPLEVWSHLESRCHLQTSEILLEPDPLFSLTLDAPMSLKPVANALSFSAASAGQIVQV